MDLKDQLLSEKELIQKAVEFKGLRIVNNVNGNPRSESIGSYRIGGDFLRTLRKNGFNLAKRKDGIVTLSWRKDYWNFRRKDDEFDELVLTLHLVMFINQRKRGVVFVPVAHGSFLGPVTGSRANYEVFKVAVRYNEHHGIHPNSLIQEVVNKGGEICVNWGKIQLGGIRSLYTLFMEFKRDRQLVDFVHSRIPIFDPDPYFFDPDPNLKVGKYFPEEFQPQLFQLWEEQIQDFKARI